MVQVARSAQAGDSVTGSGLCKADATDRNPADGLPWYGFALAAAILVRLVYLLQFAQTPFFRVAVGADVMAYDRWAREILVGGPLWRGLRIHAPLYPMFLAAVYRVTGNSLAAARACQLLLDLSSLMLTAAAVHRLWGRRTGRVCAWLWALYLPVVYYSAELFSEVLVVFFFSLALFCLSRSWTTPAGGGKLELRPRFAVLAGLSCGLACIAHPLALLYGVPIAILFPWFARGHAPAGRRRLTAWMLVALAVPILPVTWRNWVVSREFVLIQANEGLNLYIGNNPEATGTCYLRPGPEYDRVAEWPRREGARGEAEARRFFRLTVLAFTLAQPGRQAALLVRKCLLTWNRADLPSGPDLPELQRRTPLMRMPLIRFAALGPLALLGMWLCRRDPRALPFALLALAYTGGLTLFVTSGRYRIAMLPGLVALAARALTRLACLRRRQVDRELHTALVVLGVAGAAVILPSPPSIPGASVEAALLTAEAAWKTGNRAAAVAALQRGGWPDLADAASRHLMANLMAEQGRGDAAIQEFREALRLDPSRAMTYVDLGVTLSRAGHLEQARNAFEQAKTIDPSCAEAWYNLGLLEERDGNTAAAEGGYREAIRLKPTAVSPQLNLAILLYRQSAWAEAERLYRRVLRLQPRKVSALVGLGLLCFESGRTSEGVECFERVLRIMPERRELWDTYMAMLNKYGQARAARDLAVRARFRFPDFGMNNVPDEAGTRAEREPMR